MKRDRALLIVGQDMKTSYHHRGEHIFHHLEKSFRNVDLVSITKMYSGPGTDPVWKKGLLGLRDILCKRVETSYNGNIIHHVVRFPHLPGVFDYLFRDFWTYVSLHKRLKEHYDVCILGHPRLAFVAFQLKRRGKVDVLIYDDWDYFPGLRPGDLFWRHIMDYRERACVHAADGVVSVSSGLRALRKQQGAKRTALVPNGVDYAFFQPAQDKRPHPPTILYMGTLGEEWGADLPIRAMPIIRESLPDVRYLIVGAGPDENRLRTMAIELGVEDCVYFNGRQNYKDLPNFLAEADIGVATSRINAFRRYACPLKIFEYMAGGLPVIGTKFGETQAIIKNSMAGETIEFSVESFAHTAVDLLSNPSKYESYSKNAIAFARGHDWGQLLDQELAFIEQLA